MDGLEGTKRKAKRDSEPLRFFPESAKHLSAWLDLGGDEQVIDVASVLDKIDGRLYSRLT